MASAGQAPEDVAPHRFGPPASPHHAASLAGTPLDPASIVRAARGAGTGAGALIVEGVGGFAVPLTPGYLVRDLAVDLGLPTVVAARAGLGTINHTVLTVEAVRAAGLRLAGAVMTPWPARPSPLELSNRETVERLGRVAVSTLEPTGPDSLAASGARLPLDEWLAAG